MKIGDLVKYGDWYTGDDHATGLIVDIDGVGCDPDKYEYWVYVLWEDNICDWEESSVIEVVA